MHNSLQGDPEAIDDEQWELFERYNWMNAQSLEEGAWDVIVIHDPQPIGLRHNSPEASRKWIWRCHIDLSTPNEVTLGRIQPLVDEYDASVWHMEQYVPEGLGGLGERIDQPDPAGDRPALAEEHGALARRRLVRLRAVRDRRRPAADHPGLAIRPVEGPDRRDRRLPDRRRARCRGCSSRWSARWRPTIPRAGSSSTKTFKYAADDPDIKILNNLNNVGAIEVNAFQSQSDVADPEVDPRGLRADRDRGALEGPADGRPAGSVGSRFRSRRASRASW